MAQRAAAARRNDTASARRHQILEAAARLFVERGFRGTSIDDLGSALGISGPALYRYFPSKESLLSALLVGVSRELVVAVRQRTEVGRTEALHALIAFHVGFALDHTDLITVQNRDLDCLAEAEQARVRALQREYVEIWVSAVEAVTPDVDRLRVRAGVHAVFGLINSTPHSARMSRLEMGPLLETMTLAALSSLAAPGTVARSRGR